MKVREDCNYSKGEETSLPAAPSHLAQRTAGDDASIRSAFTKQRNNFHITVIMTHTIMEKLMTPTGQAAITRLIVTWLKESLRVNISFTYGDKSAHVYWNHTELYRAQSLNQLQVSLGIV